MENFEDAAVIQNAIVVLIDGSRGANPEGMSIEITSELKAIFEGLVRSSRSAGT